MSHFRPKNTLVLSKNINFPVNAKFLDIRVFSNDIKLLRSDLIRSSTLLTENRLKVAKKILFKIFRNFFEFRQYILSIEILSF